MKLVIAIIERREAKAVTHALLQGGFQVTKFNTSGGFLNTKNTTLMSAMQDEGVSRAIEIISKSSSKRELVDKVSLSHSNMPRANMPPSMKYEGLMTGEINCGGAIAFVLNVDQLVKT